MSAIVDNEDGGLYQVYKIRQKSTGKYSTGGLPTCFIENHGAEYSRIAQPKALITKLKNIQVRYAKFPWRTSSVDINDLEIVEMTIMTSKVINRTFSYDELCQKKK